jgi:hypothetical protein
MANHINKRRRKKKGTADQNANSNSPTAKAPTYMVFICICAILVLLVMICFQSPDLESFHQSIVILYGGGAQQSQSAASHQQKRNNSSDDDDVRQSQSQKRTVLFPENITIIEDLENIDLNNVPVPKHLNLIIVGDSVSRYQYTSLVYFLKFGKWINMKHPLPIIMPSISSIDNNSNTTTNNQQPTTNNQQPTTLKKIKMYAQPIAREAVPHMGLIWKQFWDSKDDWSNYTTSLMHPLEAVDCFEPNNVQWDKKFGVDNLENRYFRDPIRNNSVTLLSKLGDANNYKIPLTFKSTYSVDDINGYYNNDNNNNNNNNNINAFALSTKNKNMSSSSSSSSAKKNNSTSSAKTTQLLQTKCITKLPDETYKTNNWTEFIHEFVAKFEPKPNAFMFNQGLWPHNEFQKPAVYEQIIKAISDAGMISIYKTTTKHVSAESATNELYEQKICELVDYCLDLSWTYLVPDYLYADRGHFFEPAYSWFNIGLLDILSSVVSGR